MQDLEEFEIKCCAVIYPHTHLSIVIAVWHVTVKRYHSPKYNILLESVSGGLLVNLSTVLLSAIKKSSNKAKLKR